nr:short-chain dehydrogenase/reductase 2b-like isoform X1 [Setaria viridis]
MEGGALSDWRNKRIAVVTGGNKGIGLEVCRQLAGNGVAVVLTARDETRGAAAVEKLREAGHSDVIFHQLEVTDALSIARLADFLKASFGKLDILVNNAAVGGAEYVQGLVYPSTGEDPFAGMDEGQMSEWMRRNTRETHNSAKETLRTNYYGTKQGTEALLPLLQASADGRIVNVSSVIGQLRVKYFFPTQFLNPVPVLILTAHVAWKLKTSWRLSMQYFVSEELKHELNDVDTLTEERLDEVLDAFMKDFTAGAAEANGWPVAFSAYKVTKAAVNAYTRILARRHLDLRVNCAHPGFVKTDMNKLAGLLTPEEGARNVVKVALLPAGGPTGKYFAVGHEAPFM